MRPLTFGVRKWWRRRGPGRGAAHRLSTSEVEGAVERWSRGLDAETAGQRDWLRTHGKYWPEDYKLRLNPESELQPHIRGLLDAPDGGTLDILDVGSGPLTVLGKRWGNRELKITAVDPLAERYAELYEQVGVMPLVYPIAGEAENVADLFSPDSFDLVYAQNCLDHGYDPLRSMQQLITLVRPDGLVLLEHAIDEGAHENYDGPHQWNFRADNGRLIIWRPGLWVDAHSVLERQAGVELEELPEIRWLRVVLRKSAASLPARAGRDHAKLAP